MGEVDVNDLRNGTAPSKPFSIEVKCQGHENPAAGLVHVYFQGKSTIPGVLELDPISGSAKGVALNLKNEDDTDLAFGDTHKQALTWQGAGEGNSELYRYSGKARYVQTAGKISGGHANASLTYIIEYN